MTSEPIVRTLPGVRKMIGRNDQNGVVGDLSLLPLFNTIDLSWDGKEMGRRGFTVRLTRKQAFELARELVEMCYRMDEKR